MDTDGAHRVVGVHISQYQFMYFSSRHAAYTCKGSTSVGERISRGLYSPGFLSFPRALSIQPHYKKNAFRDSWIKL